MKGLLFIVAAFLFLIITTSVAQFRYAATNIFASTSLLLNIGITVALIAVGIYLKTHSDKNNDQGFRLSGSKGGKSSKKKSDPSKVTSAYPYP